MSTLKEKTATRSVNVEDVDDIIGVAAELMQADTEKLTVEELEEVGRELDIPAQYVQRAIETLTMRRQEAARAEARARQKAKKLQRIILASAGALVLLLIILAVIGRNNLRSTLAEVEQKQAQVRNVMVRQIELQARYEGLVATPDRDAELSGAQNRVYVERRRYDEAAAAYNAAAGGFPGNLWARLFGLPEQVPLSNQIEEW